MLTQCCCLACAPERIRSLECSFRAVQCQRKNPNRRLQAQPTPAPPVRAGDGLRAVLRGAGPLAALRAALPPGRILRREEVQLLLQLCIYTLLCSGVRPWDCGHYLNLEKPSIYSGAMLQRAVQRLRFQIGRQACTFLPRY